jgi:regulator of replication initiation timing
MVKNDSKPSKSKISLDETLERFSNQKSKVVTISDLQHEINNIKKDIFELKKEVNDLKFNNKALEQELLISKLKGCFPKENSDNESTRSEHSDEAQSNNVSPSDVKIISLINKIYPPR